MPDTVSYRDIGDIDAVQVLREASALGVVACVGKGDLFYPETVVQANAKERAILTNTQLQAAQELCVRCVVFEACSIAGKDESYGVWAGVNRGARPNTQRRQVDQMVRLRTSNSKS